MLIRVGCKEISLCMEFFFKGLDLMVNWCLIYQSGRPSPASIEESYPNGINYKIKQSILEGKVRATPQISIGASASNRFGA